MAILNQCCCGISLQMGTIIIAVFYLIVSLAPVAITTPYWDKRKNSTETFPKNITVFEDENWAMWVSVNKNELKGFGWCGIVQAICAVFLILGAALEKPLLLIPWVIVESLMILIMTIIGIMLATLLLITDEYTKYGIILIFAVIIYVLISVYCLLVVYSFYDTVRDRTVSTFRVSGRV